MIIFSSFCNHNFLFLLFFSLSIRINYHQECLVRTAIASSFLYSDEQQDRLCGCQRGEVKSDVRVTAAPYPSDPIGQTSLNFLALAVKQLAPTSSSDTVGSEPSCWG
jgi:hypothetical protein